MRVLHSRQYIRIHAVHATQLPDGARQHGAIRNIIIYQSNTQHKPALVVIHNGVILRIRNALVAIQQNLIKDIIHHIVKLVGNPVAIRVQQLLIKVKGGNAEIFIY